MWLLHHLSRERGLQIADATRCGQYSKSIRVRTDSGREFSRVISRKNFRAGKVTHKMTQCPISHFNGLYIRQPRLEVLTYSQIVYFTG